MELTKVESIVLISLITDSIGIESLIDLLGKEDVEKLDAIATDFAGNTTPNEMVLIGPSAIKKLFNSVLQTKEK